MSNDKTPEDQTNIFISEIQSYINKTELLTTQPTKLYHRTRINSGIKIRRMRCLQFTDHHTLNKKNNYELMQMKIILGRTLKGTSNESLLDYYESIINENLTVYTISFTDEIKSFEPQMLKRYGNTIIETDYKRIKQFTKDFKHSRLLFSKVLYRESEQLEIISNILKIYNKFTANNELQQRLLQYILILAPLFKDEKFSIENEYRLITYE